ncbi:uncharacterized protein [Notamacropus eugenii]
MLWVLLPWHIAPLLAPSEINLSFYSRFTRPALESQSRLEKGPASSGELLQESVLQNREGQSLLRMDLNGASAGRNQWKPVKPCEKSRQTERKLSASNESDGSLFSKEDSTMAPRRPAAAVAEDDGDFQTVWATVFQSNVMKYPVADRSFLTSSSESARKCGESPSLAAEKTSWLGKGPLDNANVRTENSKWAEKPWSSILSKEAKSPVNATLLEKRPRDERWNMSSVKQTGNSLSHQRIEPRYDIVHMTGERVLSKAVVTALEEKAVTLRTNKQWSSQKQGSWNEGLSMKQQGRLDMKMGRSQVSSLVGEARERLETPSPKSEFHEPKDVLGGSSLPPNKIVERSYLVNQDKTPGIVGDEKAARLFPRHIAKGKESPIHVSETVVVRAAHIGSYNVQPVEMKKLDSRSPVEGRSQFRDYSESSHSGDLAKEEPFDLRSRKHFGSRSMRKDPLIMGEESEWSQSPTPEPEAKVRKSGSVDLRVTERWRRRTLPHDVKFDEFVSFAPEPTKRHGRPADSLSPRDASFKKSRHTQDGPDSEESSRDLSDNFDRKTWQAKEREQENLSFSRSPRSRHQPVLPGERRMRHADGRGIDVDALSVSQRSATVSIPSDPKDNGGKRSSRGSEHFMYSSKNSDLLTRRKQRDARESLRTKAEDGYRSSILDIDALMAEYKEDSAKGSEPRDWKEDRVHSSHGGFQWERPSTRSSTADNLSQRYDWRGQKEAQDHMGFRKLVNLPGQLRPRPEESSSMIPSGPEISKEKTGSPTHELSRQKAPSTRFTPPLWGMPQSELSEQSPSDLWKKKTAEDQKMEVAPANKPQNTKCRSYRAEASTPLHDIKNTEVSLPPKTSPVARDAILLEDEVWAPRNSVGKREKVSSLHGRTKVRREDYDSDFGNIKRTDSEQIAPASVRENLSLMQEARERRRDPLKAQKSLPGENLESTVAYKEFPHWETKSSEDHKNREGQSLLRMDLNGASAGKNQWKPVKPCEKTRQTERKLSASKESDSSLVSKEDSTMAPRRPAATLDEDDGDFQTVWATVFQSNVMKYPVADRSFLTSSSESARKCGESPSLAVEKTSWLGKGPVDNANVRTENSKWAEKPWSSILSKEAKSPVNATLMEKRPRDERWNVSSVKQTGNNLSHQRIEPRYDIVHMTGERVLSKAVVTALEEKAVTLRTNKRWSSQKQGSWNEGLSMKQQGRLDMKMGRSQVSSLVGEARQRLETPSPKSEFHEPKDVLGASSLPPNKIVERSYLVNQDKTPGIVGDEKAARLFPRHIAKGKESPIHVSETVVVRAAHTGSYNVQPVEMKKLDSRSPGEGRSQFGDYSESSHPWDLAKEESFDLRSRKHFGSRSMRKDPLIMGEESEWSQSPTPEPEAKVRKSGSVDLRVTERWRRRTLRHDVKFDEFVSFAPEPTKRHGRPADSLSPRDASFKKSRHTQDGPDSEESSRDLSDNFDRKTWQAKEREQEILSFSRSPRSRDQPVLPGERRTRHADGRGIDVDALSVSQRSATVSIPSDPKDNGGKRSSRASEHFMYSSKNSDLLTRRKQRDALESLRTKAEDGYRSSILDIDALMAEYKEDSVKRSEPRDWKEDRVPSSHGGFQWERPSTRSSTADNLSQTYDWRGQKEAQDHMGFRKSVNLPGQLRPRPEESSSMIPSGPEISKEKTGSPTHELSRQKAPSTRFTPPLWGMPQSELSEQSPSDLWKKKTAEDQKMEVAPANKPQNIKCQSYRAEASTPLHDIKNTEVSLPPKTSPVARDAILLEDEVWAPRNSVGKREKVSSLHGRPKVRREDYDSDFGNIKCTYSEKIAPASVRENLSLMQEARERRRDPLKAQKSLPGENLESTVAYKEFPHWETKSSEDHKDTEKEKVRPANNKSPLRGFTPAPVSRRRHSFCKDKKMDPFM